jgi:hypothetical protein
VAVLTQPLSVYGYMNCAGGVLARRRALDAQIQNFDACCDPRRGPADLPNRAVTLGPNIGPKLLSTGCHGEIPGALAALEKSPKMLTG